jgi:hypothetical protein
MHPMSVYPYSNELKITDRSQHCSGGRLKYSSIPIARSSRQKNQQRNSRIEWYHRSNESDMCLWSFPSYNSTMFIFVSFICMSLIIIFITFLGLLNIIIFFLKSICSRFFFCFLLMSDTRTIFYINIWRKRQGVSKRKIHGVETLSRKQNESVFLRNT